MKKTNKDDTKATRQRNTFFRRANRFTLFTFICFALRVVLLWHLALRITLGAGLANY